MRLDDNGNSVPGTLGEYYDLCHALAPDSAATQLLERKIAEQGRDEEVILPDSQMRALLMPMLVRSQDQSPALPIHVRVPISAAWREAADIAEQQVQAGSIRLHASEHLVRVETLRLAAFEVETALADEQKTPSEPTTGNPQPEVQQNDWPGDDDDAAVM